MIDAVRFSHPWLLAGLLLVPLYAWYRRRILLRDAVPHAPLQYRRPENRRSRLDGVRLLAEVFLVSAAVVGLAGPHRETELELIEGEGIDVMLVLDVSLSMLAEDFPPNRLEALRRIADDFISRSAGHRIGVLIFAKDVFVQSPLTTDVRTLKELLESVTVHTLDQAKSGGTAVGDALAVAADRLHQVQVDGRDQALVLITDGESNSGMDPLLAARYVHHQGIRLYAIGIGGDEKVEVFFEGQRVGGEDSPYFAYLDDTELRAVVEAAEGHFFRATDAGALAEIFAHLSRLESSPLEVRTVKIRRFRTSYLALGALPFFAAYLVLGGVVLRRPFR